MVNENPGSSQDSATWQIRRLHDGHTAAQAWLIERFTPAVYLAARRRLVPPLRGLYDPEDLVQEVWAVALPRLQDLRAQNDHFTPVILQFLSSILLNKVRNLMQKHLREKRANAEAGPPPSLTDLAQQLPDEATTIVSRAIRHETFETFKACIDRLQPDDQRIVVLRGIEQVSNQEAAMVLGLPPATVSTRYRRALSKLKNMLPNSIFQDLALAETTANP